MSYGHNDHNPLCAIDTRVFGDGADIFHSVDGADISHDFGF